MKTIEEYSKEEIEKFDFIHEVLKKYNSLLGEGIDPVILPDFTDNEMMEYSRYRELVIARECDN